MANPTAYYVDPGLQDRASVTLTNTTTTAHCQHTAHGYATNDIVKIYGANEADYNGPGFTITKIDNDNYDYTMAGDPGGSATGSPLASKVNSGTGITSDAYPDTQYALDTITRGSDGDEINLQKDTAEVLAAAIDLATYGIPDFDQPLVFRPYNTTRLDIGGVGVGAVDCNGTSFFTAIKNHVDFHNLHVHNSGSGNILNLSIGCGVFFCEVDDTTGDGISLSSNCMALDNYVHNIGTDGINASAEGIIKGNYITNDGASMTVAIRASQDSLVAHNICSVTGATGGIFSSLKFTKIWNNSILSAGGTGHGIEISGTRENQDVWDNLVEGFSGTGGAGYDGNNCSRQTHFFNNAFFNNTTDILAQGDTIELEDQNNVSAGSTLFAKSGSDTFANRAVYFAPVAAYQGVALPTAIRLDQGGVQHADPAGGAASVLGGGNWKGGFA